jgi:FKBP-type peptidyl-prolyl cis-trans isomerase
MAARKRDRVFAIVVVILFLFTSLGLSLLVIWENSHTSNTTGSATNNATASASTDKKTSVAGTKLSGFTPVATVNNLGITDLKVGTGQVAKAGDTVSVYYTGAVAATGIIFQSTSDSGQAATLSLSSVIQGWAKGIPGMKVGGTRQLLIPAAEAYGASPPSGSGIPANAPLVFNVTLNSIGGS